MYKCHCETIPILSGLLAMTNYLIRLYQLMMEWTKMPKKLWGGKESKLAGPRSTNNWARWERVSPVMPNSKVRWARWISPKQLQNPRLGKRWLSNDWSMSNLLTKWAFPTKKAIRTLMSFSKGKKFRKRQDDRLRSWKKKQTWRDFWKWNPNDWSHKRC